LFVLTTTDIYYSYEQESNVDDEDEDDVESQEQSVRTTNNCTALSRY